MSASVPSHGSARMLVPGLQDLGPWYRAEVHGLTETQLDFAAPAPAPEWLWWSMRRQASHMARVCFLWLFVIWGDRLWDGHLPPVHDLPGVLNMPPPAGQSPTSQLNPATYRTMDAILARLEEGLALTQAVLARHTVAQARQLSTTLTPAPHVQPVMGLLQQAHPQGFTPSLTDATQWIVSLEGTGRHLYFEGLTHLYNIQRLKRAQGLMPCVALPRTGYYVLPGWDNDLPDAPQGRCSA